MANGSTATRSGGAYLEFEKPIAKLESQIEELQLAQEQKAETGRDFSEDIRKLRSTLVSLVRKTYASLNAWETVQVARHPANDRPKVVARIVLIAHLPGAAARIQKRCCPYRTARRLDRQLGIIYSVYLVATQLLAKYPPAVQGHVGPIR